MIFILLFAFFRAESKNFSVRSWSRPFLPGASGFFFAWSRSHVRQLGRPEPEPAKKVAAPQHWFFRQMQYTGT